MTDVVVKIKPALPKGQYNGLSPMGDHISQNRNSNVVAVAILGMPDVLIDAGENETVTLRIIRIEAITDPEQAAVLRSLLRQVHERRLGKRSLPGMEFDDDKLADLIDEETT